MSLFDRVLDKCIYSDGEQTSYINVATLDPFKSFWTLRVFPTHLELLDSLAQLFWGFVREVSLQVVFLSLVDPLLHLLHLLPQSHGLIEATFKSRLLGIGLQEKNSVSQKPRTHTHTHRSWMKVKHLLAYVLPLTVEFVQ